MSRRRFLFDQVSIIGLGLIGGSLGLALKKRRVSRRVIGFARREATLRIALARGAIDEGCTELCPEWLGDSDVVIIATPPRTVVPIARKILRMTSGSLLLTDVASTKAEIVRSLKKNLPSRIRFVGSHPMAGSEKSGINAADPKLFEGTTCVMTRTARTPKDALKKVSKLWKAVGSRTLFLTPHLHDTLVAQISHLPHLAAVALAVTPEPRAIRLAAGGFVDTTRIALSDPNLWEEICAMNRQEIIRALDRYLNRMKKLRSLLAHKNDRSLRRNFKQAKASRQRVRTTG